MRYLLMTILLCTQLHSHGQSQQNEFRKISIGITFSPAYCFRNLHYAQSNKWIEDLRNENEVPIFGYSTGANIKYNLSEKNEIRTGLLFSLNGEQTKYQDLQWQSEVNNYPQKAKSQFRYKYLTIPFEFAHYFGSNQLRFFAATGVSLNVFTQKKTNVISIYDNDKKISSSSVDVGYNKINIAACVSAGIEYHLSKRFSLSFAPYYARFLNSVVADKQAKEYSYSLGCNAGIYYKLRKKEKARN